MAQKVSCREGYSSYVTQYKNAMAEWIKKANLERKMMAGNKSRKQIFLL